MIEEEHHPTTSISPYRSMLGDFLLSGPEKVEAERNQATSNSRRSKLGAFLYSDPNLVSSFNNGVPRIEEDGYSHRPSNASTSISPLHYGTPPPTFHSADASPYMSPWNQSSPYSKSPWILPSPLDLYDLPPWSQSGLIGSLVREEGHIYSLAVSGDLLYTGSDSKNIRVWKRLREYSGFKSKSGLIKAIILFGDKIFTGHQDGKIRIWKFSPNSKRSHKRIGSLPTFKDYVKSSMKRKNYVEVRRHKNVVKIKHFDAVSSLSFDREQGLMYSGSWDKTVKVWRISDSKCLESIDAHDDAVNSVAVGFQGLAFSGSADGTVKAWRREVDVNGKTKHVLQKVLLKQEYAITALAVNRSSMVLYCGSSDGLLNFWEGVGKKCSLRHGGFLRGHKQAVLCLADAGNLVFSGSADKNICVWKRDEKSGAHSCLSVLTGHTMPVKCLAVEIEPAAEVYEYEYDEEGQQRNQIDDSSRGGDQRWIVYSGSLDKSVKVWRVSERVPDWNAISMGRAGTGTELASACQSPLRSSAEGSFSFYSPARGIGQNLRN